MRARVLLLTLVVQLSVLGVTESAHAPGEGGIAAGSFQLSGAAGPQRVGGLGLQPKAILFFDTGLDATSDVADHGGVAIAWTDCTNVAFRGVRANDGGLANTSSSYSQSNTRIWRRWDNKLAVGSEATFVSCDADGFTWNIGVTDGATTRIGFLAFGGPNVSARADTFTKPTAAGKSEVRGLPFDPTLVFMMCGQGDTASAEATGREATLAFGAMNPAGQWGVSFAWNDGSNSSGGFERTDKVIACVDFLSPAIDDVAEFTSFDRGGYTTTFSDVDTYVDEPVYFLALRGVTSVLGSATQPASNGPQALSSFGFEPGAMLMVSRNRPTAAGVTMPGLFSIGVADRGTRVGAWTGVAHGCGMNCATARSFFTGDVLRMYTPHQSGKGSPLNAAATLQSLDKDGATLNWTTTDATAREFLYAGFRVEAGNPKR